MRWRGYIGLEDINLNNSQRQQLWQAIQQFGPQRPVEIRASHLNHWRFNLDKTKCIFEANFKDEELTIANFKTKLAAIFGLDPATIDHSTQFQTFDTLPTRIVTFGRSGTNYIRFAAFGDVTASWQQSHIEVLAYLAANLAEWGSDIL